MNQFYLNSLKKIFGIRNRFWRKRWEILKPELDQLYILSINKNYLPFRLSFSKTLLKLKEKDLSLLEIENLYNSYFVYYTNLLTNQNKIFLLDKNQKARIVKIKNKLMINIINPDGSEDPVKRKKFLEMNQKIIYYINNNKKQLVNYTFKEYNQIFVNILEPKLSRIFIQEQFDLIKDFLDSPIGKILDQYIPGLSFILEIQKEKAAMQEKDFIKIGTEILMDRVKYLTQKFIYLLTKNFTKTGKYIAPPLAMVTGIAFERYESYKKCEEILEKNFQKIALIQKEIQFEQQSREKEEQFLNNQTSEAVKKLLDL
ncbi:MAG: hypothetical protein KatS3mg129_2364 [Leptospiraceae bacterium]|nr:MAG: hypothetical protein KatS3mg129_2364 [Leptospiraceae bacterium]